MIYIFLIIILLALAIISYRKFILHYKTYKLSKEVWKSLNEKYGRDEPFRELGDVKNNEGEDE